MPTHVIETWHKNIRKKINNWTFFPGPFLTRTVFTRTLFTRTVFTYTRLLLKEFSQETGFTSEDDQKAKSRI